MTKDTALADLAQPDLASLEADLQACGDVRAPLMPAEIDAIGASLDALLDQPAPAAQSKSDEFGSSVSAAEIGASSLCRSAPKCGSESEGTSVSSIQPKQPSAEAPQPTHHEPTDAEPFDLGSALRTVPQMQGARQVMRKRRGLAPYRSLRERMLIRLSHLSLVRHGPTIAFSLDVRPDVAAKAIATDDPARYLAKAIGYHAGARPLWFALEITASGILHLHGATTCPHEPKALSALRKALRKAAGEWKTTRQHQCHTSIDPDWGWAGYSTKDFGRMMATRIVGPGEGLGRLPFSGKPWYVSRDLAAVTKTRYEAKRALSLRTKTVITDLRAPMLDTHGVVCHKDAAHDLRDGTDAFPSAHGERLRTPVRRASRRGPTAHEGLRNPHGDAPAPRPDCDDPRRQEHRARAPGRTHEPSRPPRPP